MSFGNRFSTKYGPIHLHSRKRILALECLLSVGVRKSKSSPSKGKPLFFVIVHIVFDIGLREVFLAFLVQNFRFAQ